MAACPLPSEFASLVPEDLSNPECLEIRQILENWTNLVADAQACEYEENGDITASYAEKVCAITCP